MGWLVPRAWSSRRQRVFAARADALISDISTVHCAWRKLRPAPVPRYGQAPCVGPRWLVGLMWWTWIISRRCSGRRVPASCPLALILFPVEEPELPPGIHRIEIHCAGGYQTLGHVLLRVVDRRVVVTARSLHEAFPILRAQMSG